VRLLGLYSQHFIFFITYEWAQYVRVSHYTRLEKLVRENTLAYFAQLSVMKKRKYYE
jgi:hypothetical protein